MEPFDRGICRENGGVVGKIPIARRGLEAATSKFNGSSRRVKIFESADPQSFRPVPVIAYDPALTPFFRSMNGKRLLAYISGSVDQELLVRNESLATENRILWNQIHGRLQLNDSDRITLAEIGKWPGT